ncbi:MAG: head decoration protein [Agarilytica sp.]
MPTNRLLAGNEGDTFAPEDWVTGSKDIQTGSVRLSAGQGIIPEKSVLGLVTANGEAVLSASAAGDGSEVPKMILVHEVDATLAVDAPVYLEGQFNPDLLNFGAGHNAASVKATLSDRNIYLSQPA